jgi:c-di-GMP-binding flagellar brake protein YcgR
VDRERRKFARQSVTCPARIFDKRKRLIVKGKTVDISVGGVKILGPAARLPALADQVSVKIELALPGANRTRDVKRRAFVRRIDNMGEWAAVAVEFDESDEMGDVIVLD